MSRQKSVSQRYKTSYDRIDETDESKEHTLSVIRKSGGQSVLNKEVLSKKKDLLRRLYTNPNQKQRKELITQWPNNTIQLLARKHGILQMQNKAYLIGSVVNNLIDGYALIMYSPSRFYQGNFQNNFKHGQGCEFLPNGTYLGNFVNNKPEGKGSFYWNNGEVYEGEFLAGMKHGSGRWTSPNETYMGEWKSNKPDGVGAIVSRESRYEGDVRNGLKHGNGRQAFRNGDRYTGNYANGRPEGIGQYNWSRNASSYCGSFKNGLRHSNGVWIQGGDRYEGHYLNDKKNGKGKFTWGSGNCYIGSYFNDLRHGYGDMYWNDGSWYKGEWKYGAQHGLGQTQENGQEPKRGIFEENVLVCEEDASKRLKKERVQYHRKLNAIRDRNYTQYDVKAQPLDTTQHLQIPSFTMRKPMRAKRLSFHNSNDNPSQTSNEEKEIKSTEMQKRSRVRPLKKKIKSDVDSEEQDINVIQWANIQNFAIAPRQKVRSLPHK